MLSVRLELRYDPAPSDTVHKRKESITLFQGGAVGIQQVEIRILFAIAVSSDHETFHRGVRAIV